ncbi:HAD-like protein [Venustampulla echinocandica]|uniref:HAD-like protein n=1 Tax=Venustampulla echinocandica TaxID=2656787 RepID=A0A370TQI2_9HELO|nr:HAD-like protein [Venustampulla echinocandica]RDL37783.1 HAD-like protein [Venustampulla echinocandica]
MTSPKAGKRKHSTFGGPVSPPPLRRKVQSTTTQTAVASFFTPTSQKPPEKIIWQERAPSDDTPSTLLVGKYIAADDSASTTKAGDSKRNKIAAFDFDSTLIQTSSGKRFASDSADWKWWHPSVPGRLRKLYLEEGYRVVVVSNQAGLTLKPDSKAPKSLQTKVDSFKAKVSAVFNQLDLPISIYAATAKDIYRKPRPGMWTEILDDYDLQPSEVDFEHSIFVGDAGGRHAEAGRPKDFSCSDRNFAENIGIKFYSPEEYFLDEAPKPFTRTFEPSEYLPDSTAKAIASFTRKNDQDLVIFCGSPGSGKSTFYWKMLQPLGYVRINQDILKTREKCLKVAEEYLREGKSVAVDNTNADSDVRTPVPVCEHNDAVRAFNKSMNPEKRSILSSVAFRSFTSRYQPPKLSEGFEDIIEIAFKVRRL